MNLLAYKYRIYPSYKQKIILINSLNTCKQIYNELLSLHKDVYNFGNITLNEFDLNKYLSGKFKNIHSKVKQNISNRVNKSFSNFFRRIKNNSYKKGFPRYKSRVMSMTYSQDGFKFNNKYIQISKIGILPIILHRIPKGKIKTLTIKQTKTDKWFAIFACEIPDSKVVHLSTERVGIDVGLESFATLSNGEFITNPHHLLKSESRLKILHRRVSRKKLGSSNRRKAKFKLVKLYERVSNQRSDFLHKLSRKIVKSFSFITVEDLQIRNMVKNHALAKHISDASWGNFIRMLEYKAVISGSNLIKVNPRNTSKTCSKCGSIQEIPLDIREFLCLKCSFVCHRDLNASINILNKSTVGLTETYTSVDIEPLQQISSVASLVDEAGTITAKPSTSSTVGNSVF